MAAGAGLATLMAAGGCGSSSGRGATLSAADFRGATPAAPAAAGPGAPAGPRPDAQATAPAPFVGMGDAQDISDVAVMTGRPRSGAAAGAQPAGRPVVVDALVGQVNGKPVFASRVLDTPQGLGGRLRAAGERAPSSEVFLRESGRLIGEQLQREINDELLLAEARGQLTAEERVGLISFVTRLRENLAAERAQGSQELADQSLLESEGKTLDEVARGERDKALVRVLINKYVNPRVNVSWRDVERAYRRNSAQFNPPATATIRIIRLAKTSPAVEVVKADLAAGKPFEEAASRRENIFNASGGGVLATPVPGELKDAQLVGDPVLNAAAVKLAPGETAGPVESGDFVSWVKLESLERPAGRSLADAQLELSSTLRSERFNLEFRRYMARLRERGSKSDEIEMTTILAKIAADRYLPENPRRGARPANAAGPGAAGPGAAGPGGGGPGAAP